MYIKYTKYMKHNKYKYIGYLKKYSSFQKQLKNWHSFWDMRVEKKWHAFWHFGMSDCTPS